MSYELTHLRALEAEGIHIMREVAAEFERPCLLFSGGKDSRGDARVGDPGVRSGEDPVPGDARRHRPQLPRRSSSSATAGSTEAGARLVVASVQESDRRGPGRRADRPARQSQHAPDRHAAGCDRGQRFRCRVRWRPSRRGEGPGEGAGVQLPRRLRAVGPEGPATRALEPLQRQAPQGRAHPGVPHLQLDRARHLAVPQGRGRRDPGDLLLPQAAGLRARRHVAVGVASSSS